MASTPSSTLDSRPSSTMLAEISLVALRILYCCDKELLDRDEVKSLEKWIVERCCGVLSSISSSVVYTKENILLYDGSLAEFRSEI